MSIEKTFKPDCDYSFWFYKHKFHWIPEMLDLVMEYEFAKDELDGMLLGLFIYTKMSNNCMGVSFEQ